MAKQSAAIAPTPAAQRRMRLEQVRVSVRAQLAENQRQRREQTSQALTLLHQQLQQIRSDLRTRLREIGIDAAARKRAKKTPVNSH